MGNGDHLQVLPNVEPTKEITNTFFRKKVSLKLPSASVMVPIVVPLT